ncbi:MAG: hypothetical protein A4E67_01529 [Syntrophaceae bacterium PtaB.Bin038]|nr:MAG: hypothetical protein A4E67_01529 [Syntrophaceae bacterium PtaB.Bin038]
MSVTSSNQAVKSPFSDRASRKRVTAAAAALARTMRGDQRRCSLPSAQTTVAAAGSLPPAGSRPSRQRPPARSSR